MPAEAKTGRALTVETRPAELPFFGAPIAAFATFARCFVALPLRGIAWLATYGSTLPIAIYFALVFTISFGCVAFSSAHRDDV